MPDQTAIDVSLNEIEMLAQKAARGRGAFPAQAAHFGKAAVRFLASGQDPAPLAGLLQALPQGPIQTLPIKADFDPHDGVEQCYAALRLPPQARPALPPRLSCPADFLALLQAAAQLTYVPNSDASRSAGAGAGLCDND